MQKNEKDNEEKYAKVEDAITIIFTIIITLFMIFYFTLLIIYSNKPYDEIPEWVFWFLFRR